MQNPLICSLEHLALACESGQSALMAEASRSCLEIRRVASRLAALGCTQDEVARVSSVQGVPLPDSYRCFLETMGRDVGGCFPFEFVSYPYVLQLRADAIKLLASHSGSYRDVFSLPDDAAVISMIDQGYAFMFIRTSMGDDAPVEVWSEGPEMDRSKPVFPSVLDWVQQAHRHATAPGNEASRRRHQRVLRDAFDPPSCPSCHADWSRYEELQELQDLQLLAYIGTDTATLIQCRTCGRRFDWWWGEQPRPTGA